MPQLTRHYDVEIGPVIEVLVSDSYRDRADHDAPRSETVTMLVDSGASDSWLKQEVIDRLGLFTLGFHPVSGFGKTEPTLQYLADIELQLDAPHLLPDWKLFRFVTPYDKIDGILGRDVLDRGIFTIDGPNRQFTLEF